MINYAILDETGTYVVAAGRGPVAPEEDHVLINGEVNRDRLINCYVVEGVLTERPSAPELVESGGVYSFTDCPVGTNITICDVMDGELIAEVTTDVETADQSFSFDDTGKYQIEIIPPLPYTQKTYELEVV